MSQDAALSFFETGELPDNEADLQKLIDSVNRNDVGALEQQDAVTETPATVEAEKPIEATETVQTPSEQTPDGILARDGKHVIPFNVLEAERVARQEREKENGELRRELDRLRNAKPGDQHVLFKTMTQEQLDELKEYFPTQFDAIMSQQAALAASQQKLSEFEAREHRRAEEDAQKAALHIQSIIDTIPQLSHWQANSPDIWQKCVQLDQQLMQDSKMAQLPEAERFKKVAAAIGQIYGDPTPTTTDSTKAEPAPKPASKPDPKPAPITISDLPGGHVPPTTERQSVENATAAELGVMMQKMSPAQINEFLSRL